MRSSILTVGLWHTDNYLPRLTSISDALLDYADLTDAYLEGADLTYADFTDAIVTDADFTDTVWYQTIWTDGVAYDENQAWAGRTENLNPARV